MKRNEGEVRNREYEKERSKCEVNENVGNQLRNKFTKCFNLIGLTF